MAQAKELNSTQPYSNHAINTRWVGAILMAALYQWCRSELLRLIVAA
jgi:hypothetical protein